MVSETMFSFQSTRLGTRKIHRLSTEAEIFSYVLSPLSLWGRGRGWGKIPQNFCLSTYQERL